MERKNFSGGVMLEGQGARGNVAISVAGSGKGGPTLEEIKGLAETSLSFLCRYILWKDQGPEERHWSKVHEDLELFLMRPSLKKAILLPRGHLKSSVVTVGKAIQHIIQNKNVRILVANQVWDVARDFLRSIKGYLESSQLQYLGYGPFVSQRWNEDAITIRQRNNRGLKEPTVQTTGAEAEKTGGHYDVIFLDDLTGFMNVGTPEQREKTKRFRRSMIDLLEPGGKIYECGTRWHLDDTFGDILEKETKYYDVMTRRVVEGGKIIFPEKFAKRFDPVKKIWSSADDTCMDFIDHLRASHTTAEFSAQYMNNPIDEENQIFRETYFKYWERRPYGIFTAITVDLAISEKLIADRTAIVCTGMDKSGNLFVMDYLVGRWGVSDIVKNIFDMQEKWKPQALGIETNGFQRVLKWACEEEMRKRRKFFPIDEIRSPIQGDGKTYRIKSIEPFYREGKIFHASWMKGRDLEQELLTFPKGKHDDIPDALAMSLNLLTPGDERKFQVDDYMTAGWWERKIINQNDKYRSFFHYG